MSELLLQSNKLSQWHELVQEAQQAASHQLNEDCESYLVFLLMRFLDQVTLAERVVALDYLESAHATGQAQQQLLQEVGDTCLVLSGLFPGRAERRQVTVNYYVGVGQQAYGSLSTLSTETLSELYSNLQSEFVALMDVLQAIRGFTSKELGLSSLQAEQLWQSTGSHMAKQHLEQSLKGVSLEDVKRLAGIKH